MALRIVVFLLVATLLFGGGHWFLWARLVRDPAWPQWVHRPATFVLVGLAVLLPLSFALFRSLPQQFVRPLAWLTYTWMGLGAYLLLLLGGLELLRALARWTHSLPDLHPTDPDKRSALARALSLGVSFLGLGILGTGMRNALTAIAVKELRLSLPKLAPSKNGYVLVQLSDVHVGPTIGTDFVRELVTRVNALEPDLVVITGDLVDGSVETLGSAVAELAKLRSKDGVFFVTGNHEYYSGVVSWTAFLQTLGIRVLHNERVAIGGDGGFDLAGVPDWTAHQFAPEHRADLPKALAGRDLTKPVILLAHQPKAVLEAAKLGVDLQLSGHTHGGQFAPFNLFVKLQQPYVGGLNKHENTQLYISLGTGYWGPPIRINAPAEITKIVLSSGAPA